MMDALAFASLMEHSIIDDMEGLRGSCSPELSRAVELLIRFHGEFERLVTTAKMSAKEQTWPELTAAVFVGTDETWREITGSIHPGTVPLAADYTALWCIHALLDKSAQFYQQAARQNIPEQERIFLGSVAELKLILHRRMDGVERVVANQVWKSVGFPPGLLGKE
jgi:hypothetical protein